MARASAAARGGAMSGLACAETRVLAHSSPGSEFALFFSHRFLRCVLKKLRHLAGCTVQEISELSCSHLFVGVFYVFRISHRFCSVCCRISTFGTCQLGLPFLLQLRAGVGGLMTSMRMRILSCVSLVEGAVHWWGGGVGGGDDVHANAASVLCFSRCFEFCTLVGRGGMGAFRIGVCGVFLKFPGRTVPTLDFSHLPAWTSMCMYLTSVQSWGGGHGCGGGGGGLMTSMRMRLTCTDCFPFCSVHWWGGGGWGGC